MSRLGRGADLRRTVRFAPPNKALGPPKRRPRAWHSQINKATDDLTNRADLILLLRLQVPKAKTTCFFVSRREMERKEKTFRAWFPSSLETPRPVRMQRFDGDARGIAYALKPDFYRRISLAPRIPPSGERSTFGTRKKPIGGEKRIELALALD
jgi:hypothetical protein